ncbi:MAG: response regulator [Bacteroidota bacterium]|jgi:CRP-like cAMP-binding protein|uniref:response regulator n=1 Tax=Candidatus Pollutiaquabacter sp. TaxID=3416354 RepID=UPI001A415876|nr:response regulator [Bacteroidota bacterium]MBL7948054.1 response regulator [Bacteroidia bacterium]MBP6009852.1 response regulator [Bacteroidia bacterium]MBP7269915.1 response regulator [Bacteroidia bacterium]MBP7436433.1 response regulator [Bacteroidia bacterium]
MKKILLIEDNADMRENTAEILELANYKVISAPNGRVGVEKASKENPDLIICDIMMPELDGYGVLYLLSKNPSTASIPFIFLTAKAEKADLRKGMSMGADDYLTKPFEEMELLNAVEARLRKSDVFRKEFTKNIEGLSEFLAQARGLEELSRLSADRKVHHFKKKEMIYMEGDEPNGIIFVVKGRIKTYKTNEDGKEFITGIHKEGDFLGYIDLIENTEYRESAEAMDEAEVTIIPRQDFFSLLYSNRDVAAKFIKLLSNNLQETEDRLLNLAYNSVRKRVADALITLQQRYHTAKDQNSGFSVSREDLASMVGTATESVIRTLSDFKEEKLIDIKEKNIFILNPDRLSRMKN